mgnify:FL=1
MDSNDLLKHRTRSLALRERERVVDVCSHLPFCLSHRHPAVWKERKETTLLGEFLLQFLLLPLRPLSSLSIFFGFDPSRALLLTVHTRPPFAAPLGHPVLSVVCAGALFPSPSPSPHAPVESAFLSCPAPDLHSRECPCFPPHTFTLPIARSIFTRFPIRKRRT